MLAVITCYNIIVNYKYENVEHVKSGGNRNIPNFYLAKKHLRKVFDGFSYTFYCGCFYSLSRVSHKSCLYKAQNFSLNKRSKRVEWEHVVPASVFGRSFRSWSFGHPRCVINGKRFKGRKCLQMVSNIFRRMEADLYNLVPSIGEINASRGNLPFGIVLSDNPIRYGGCKTLVGYNYIQPRKLVRGVVARIYLYMDLTYPGREIIRTSKQRAMFKFWHKKYPVSEGETIRAKRIERIQKNRNPFVVNNK